jgi:hypothetical protein
MKYSLFFNAAARREQQTNVSSSDSSSQLEEQHLLTIAIYATLVAVAVIAYIS